MYRNKTEKEQKKMNITQYSWDKPFVCSDHTDGSCKCNGMAWYGLLNDKLSGKRIEDFNSLRNWNTISKSANGTVVCNTETFGQDPHSGLDKQCFCEPKPKYVPTRCAVRKGNKCLCNGDVYYGGLRDANNKWSNFYEMTKGNWAVNQANNTGSVTCAPSTFEDIDPLPGKEKQCFCDE